MFVWSKRLVAALLALFSVLFAVFLFQGPGEGGGQDTQNVRWIALNYVGLCIWIFVWMIDQASVRGKNVWLWLLPFLLAPLPTLMVFILFLQRRMR